MPAYEVTTGPMPTTEVDGTAEHDGVEVPEISDHRRRMDPDNALALAELVGDPRRQFGGRTATAAVGDEHSVAHLGPPSFREPPSTHGSGPEIGGLAATLSRMSRIYHGLRTWNDQAFRPTMLRSQPPYRRQHDLGTLSLGPEEKTWRPARKEPTTSAAALPARAFRKPSPTLSSGWARISTCAEFCIASCRPPAPCPRPATEP